MDWKSKLREIKEENPNFDSFLKSRKKDWISEIGNTKAKILFRRLQKPANTPIEVTIDEALEYIDDTETGTSDLKDMILKQDKDGVYQALVQIEVTGQLRKHHGDKVEMEYTEEETKSEPDARLKTDNYSFVIEITEKESVIEGNNDAADGEVVEAGLTITDGNKMSHKISEKLERQLKHFSNNHYTVLAICSRSVHNTDVLDSHLLGKGTVEQTGEKETEITRGTPVINLDKNSEHLDMLFHYSYSTKEAYLYAAEGLDSEAVKVIANSLNIEDTIWFRNDENMEHREWKNAEQHNSEELNDDK